MEVVLIQTGNNYAKNDIYDPFFTNPGNLP